MPIYIATAEALDAEMRERIAKHRARRGSAWLERETPLELAAALVETDGHGARLVDCLTLWLSNLMLAHATLFALFSVACAFTHDLPSMIAMRGLQGFFGGVLIPMAFTLVFTKLPKAQQPIGLAMFSLAVTFAPAIGPTIGGYLTENYGWQTIFFVNVVPTAIMSAPPKSRRAR